MSERAGRYQRSFPGMIGAMLVLLLVVAAFVVFRDTVRDEPADPVGPVDYLRPAEYARTVADFPVLVPERLPEGWFANGARYVPGDEESWHVGFLTEDREYVGLEQTDRPPAALVEEHVDEEAVQGEDVTIDGVTWQTWTDEGGDTALVREQEAVTTLVVGTVDQDTLVEFVRSLR